MPLVREFRVLLLTHPSDKRSLVLDLVEDKFLSDTQELQIQISIRSTDGEKNNFKGRRSTRKSAVLRRGKLANMSELDDKSLNKY